ncbi:DUF309 domain-containing protein [Hoyosella rhizosphaerae]|uniref:DUF309 domain-containing protein n=1 Tax=Hoyosella rhizosphaerae TaxID=1755582 RepID=UPI00166676F6|nr:DUF309 domain-containing protein [Hoyosella rhizosphaerae]MBN4927266.1 DUF309 domain-containing protein [Hoyosella rhizosphaerae]
MNPSSRNRDEQGRPFNQRPRDALGRPLPYGARDTGADFAVEYESPEQALVVAERLLSDRAPFHAHEILEEAWKADTTVAKEMWRGLAQLAVGVTHAARGNMRGAVALLTRASHNLTPFADNAAHGVRVRELVDWCNTQVDVCHKHPSGVELWLTVPKLHDKQ